MTIELPTEGKIHERLQTLSPTGTLRFRFYGKTFFSFLDFMLFVGAALATWVVVERRARSKSTAAMMLLFLALTYLWFSQGPAASFAASVFGGVILICAFLLLRTGRERWKSYRAERWALAPDPFLEQADAPKKEKKRRKGRKGRAEAMGDASPAEADPSATGDSGTNDSAKPGGDAGDAGEGSGSDDAPKKEGS